MWSCLFLGGPELWEMTWGAYLPPPGLAGDGHLLLGWAVDFAFGKAQAVLSHEIAAILHQRPQLLPDTLSSALSSSLASPQVFHVLVRVQPAPPHLSSFTDPEISDTWRENVPFAGPQSQSCDPRGPLYPGRLMAACIQPLTGFAFSLAAA